MKGIRAVNRYRKCRALVHRFRQEPKELLRQLTAGPWAWPKRRTDQQLGLRDLPPQDRHSMVAARGQFTSSHLPFLQNLLPFVTLLDFVPCAIVHLHAKHGDENHERLARGAGRARLLVTSKAEHSMKSPQQLFCAG